jgi:tetratricopeptide (TPR) repeat protein
VISEPQNIVSRYVQRRALLLSLILLGLLFVITVALARTYHTREEGLTTEWFQKGNSDLANGKPAMAFEDFRNSLSYGPENTQVQLRLAEALLADGRFTEARSYLTNLWDRTPGSGEVNLDLAQVSMQTGDVDQTIHYFRGAILGSWEKEPALQRRKVRLELCEFLLAHRMTDDAQAEIAGLAAETPAGDGVLLAENGRLFLRAGKSGRALAEFESALRIDPQQSQWLADAGQVAFEDGDYLKAETYFSKSDRENPSPEIHASLVLVRDVLGNDPYLAGLSDEEQARRILRDFDLGLERLHNCSGNSGNGSSAPSSVPSPSELQLLNKDAQDLQKRINLPSLSGNPEFRNDAMQFVYRIEDTASRICGPATGLDQALTLIEKRHEGNNL